MKGLDVFIGVSGVLVVALMVTIVYRVRSDQQTPSDSYHAMAQSADRAGGPADVDGPLGGAHPTAGTDKLFYASNEPLPPGYKCSPADGYVYRPQFMSDGLVSMVVFKRHGVIVRCARDRGGHAAH